MYDVRTEGGREKKYPKFANKQNGLFWTKRGEGVKKYQNSVNVRNGKPLIAIADSQHAAGRCATQGRSEPLSMIRADSDFVDGAAYSFYDVSHIHSWQRV